MSKLILPYVLSLSLIIPPLAFAKNEDPNVNHVRRAAPKAAKPFSEKELKTKLTSAKKSVDSARRKLKDLEKKAALETKRQKASARENALWSKKNVGKMNASDKKKKSAAQNALKKVTDELNRTTKQVRHAKTQLKKAELAFENLNKAKAAAKKLADDKAKAEAAAKAKAEIDRLKAEAAAKGKAEAERLKAEAAAKAKAEAERLKAEAAAKAKAETERLKAEAAAKAKAETERLKTEAEAKAKAETERLKAEAAAKAKAETERLNAEAAAKAKLPKAWREATTEEGYQIENAFTAGDINAFRQLMASGINPNSQIGSRLQTLLVVAIQRGNDPKVKAQIVKELLAAGANPNGSEDSGYYRPVYWAAYEGNLEIFKALKEAGANMLVKNMYGRTPLDIVRNSWSQGENSKIVDYLLTLPEFQGK